MEHVIYNSENSKWYRHDHSFAVRDAGKGNQLPPDPGITANGYLEAFQTIFQHDFVMPGQVRAPRRESAQ